MLSPETLTKDNFAEGLNFLVSRDPDLAEIFQTLGTPPLWVREPGFSTLIQIILEQQVSLASAKAVYTRLQATISPITPELFLLVLDDVLIVLPSVLPILTPNHLLVNYLVA